jgi:predicted  nucleic acid-binding Zn-ribbon protein
MARTENQRPETSRKLSPPAPASRPADLPPADLPLAAAPNDAAPESLDKVRDILFGGQMRAVESRLQGLEERLMREQAVIRSDFDKRLADLDASAKRDAQTLGDRLNAERTKRTEELKALSAEIKEILRSLEKRHVKLEELSGLADAEIRDQILQQSRAIGAEIERLSQRVSTDLNREVASLRNDKTDVSAIVGVFSDMATRLAGESRPQPKPSRS